MKNCSEMAPHVQEWLIDHLSNGSDLAELVETGSVEVETPAGMTLLLELKFERC